MDFDRAKISRKLDLCQSVGGEDCLVRIMCCYFSGIAGPSDRSRAIITSELACAESFGGFDEDTCNAFRDWFAKIDFGVDQPDHYENFRTLCVASRDFMLLCYSLHCDCFRFRRDEIHLTSNNRSILTTDKSVAAAESGFFDSLFDLSPYTMQGEIAVPREVPGHVLSEIMDFCQKKLDFREILESVAGHFKGWVTSFLQRNRAILSDLHQAAEFLNIPSLLVFTSKAMGDRVGRTMEEITDWCGKLSLSRLVSSLVVGVGMDVRYDHGGGPWPFA